MDHLDVRSTQTHWQYSILSVIINWFICIIWDIKLDICVILMWKCSHLYHIFRNLTPIVNPGLFALILIRNFSFLY